MLVTKVCYFEGVFLLNRKLFELVILVDILQPDGTEAAPNELGRVVIKLPLPPGNMSTLYKNGELFEKTYFKKFPVISFDFL